jgi:hypothetical protein
MSRATSEEWSRYYEGARQRRRAVGADPLVKYRERKETQERHFFIGSSLLLAGVLAAFYSVFIR